MLRPSTQARIKMSPKRLATIQKVKSQNLTTMKKKTKFPSKLSSHQQRQNQHLPLHRNPAFKLIVRVGILEGISC